MMEGKKKKYKDMNNTEIRNICFEECPCKCTDNLDICEAVSIRQCRKHLSDQLD